MKEFLVLGLVLVMLVLIASPVLAEGGSWGVGFGIPYGVMGVNLDYNIISNFDLSLGLGISPLSGFAYNIGGKLYLASEEKSFRPRVSYYYGTNTTVDETGYYDFVDKYTNYNGVTAGIGATVYFGQSSSRGLDFDLLFRVSTEADVDQLKAKGYDTDDIEERTFSIGYRQKF